MPVADVLNGIALKGFERKFFVGRQQEIRLFRNLLEGSLGDKRIVSLYGIGGMGKSFMLDEYRRLASETGTRFLLIDSRDFEHAPRFLCERTIHLLDGFCPNDAAASKPLPIAEAIRKINLFAANQRLCIAFDSYEELGTLDAWIREQFIPQLHSNTIFVFAGRYPLQGMWKQSPAWRSMIAWVPLGELAYPEVREYASRHDIRDEAWVRSVWNNTHGHPLSLSLAVYAATTGDESRSRTREAVPVDPGEWMREVRPVLRPLVEAASVLRHFHQELLAAAMGEPVSRDAFQELTQLSFVRKAERGWILHDVVRAALAEDVRTRTPERHNLLWKRCALYAYNRLLHRSPGHTDADWQATDAFFYLGDGVVRELFYSVSAPRDWVSVDATNAAEAEKYLERSKRRPRETRIEYDDPDGGTMEDVVTAEQSLCSVSRLELEETRNVEGAQVRLLRAPSGETAGLAVAIPINKDTLDNLLSNPLSSPYFRSLGEQQLTVLRTQAGAASGLWIQGIDVSDFGDAGLRSDAGELLTSFILSSDFVAFATPPYAFLRDALKRLGFEPCGAPESPAAFVLDRRGRRNVRYWRSMLQRLGMEESVPERKSETNDALSGLTERERQIVDLIGQGLTNVEVAKRLYLSEITVKKHLTSIFTKLGIRNRTQLVRRL